jgi:hypothetical protein
MGVVGIFDIKGIEESGVYVVGDESVGFPVRVFIWYGAVVVDEAFIVVLFEEHRT